MRHWLKKYNQAAVVVLIHSSDSALVPVTKLHIFFESNTISECVSTDIILSSESSTVITKPSAEKAKAERCPCQRTSRFSEAHLRNKSIASDRPVLTHSYLSVQLEAELLVAARIWTCGVLDFMLGQYDPKPEN